MIKELNIYAFYSEEEYDENNCITPIVAITYKEGAKIARSIINLGSFRFRGINRFL